MKKTVIAGIFVIIGALITGYFSYIAGGTNAINKVNNEVSQVVNIDNGDYAEITQELMTTNQNLEKENEDLASDRDEWKRKYDELVNLNFDKATDEIKLSTSKNYLFDNKPFLVEGVWAYMLNNNQDTIFIEGGDFSYPADYRMESTGKAYYRGMAITPYSSKLGEIYYNLDKKYSYLSGKIAFEDAYSERIDYKYIISIYADNSLINSFEITKGEVPVSFDLNINQCEILKITFERPPGDQSDNPNINLIEFELY